MLCCNSRIYDNYYSALNSISNNYEYTFVTGCLLLVTCLSRDQFPKMDLFKGFIGDGYPLCVDQPDKQFLRIGATYRLLGSSTIGMMHNEDQGWRALDKLLRVNLSSSSALHAKLCNRNQSTNLCDFKPQIVLDENLACDSNGVECKVDNVRLVRVQEDPDIFYEYIRPACVELVFAQDEALTKIVDHQKNAMCSDKRINDQVMPSLCPDPAGGTAQGKCEFSMERTSYATSSARGVMCDHSVRCLKVNNCQCLIHCILLINCSSLLECILSRSTLRLLREHQE